ncbi:AMP-binding protein [Microbispora siamensis]|uniref:AMP-binding protein n=1 Tax=Microbispora siamensis TaxID=564413 RepID=UPI003570A94F
MALNVASLFEAVAAAVPGRLALVCDARRLSFAELDARANALANHLLAAGVPVGQVRAFNANQEERWLRPSLGPSSSTRCAHRSASVTEPCPGCTRPSCSVPCSGA